MTRRCYRRGREGRDALFDWTRNGHDIQPGEVRDNPLTRHCPCSAGGCGSPPFEPCTKLARGRGRIEIIGRYHDARHAPVSQQPPGNRPSGLVRATGDSGR